MPLTNLGTIYPYTKNYAQNGDMNIAQKGTSFAAATNGTFPLDRYQYVKTGTMVHTISQDTDVPSEAQAGYLLQNSMLFTLTTPQTSIAAGDQATIAQNIEGYNFANIAQKAFTISFWVKATTTGTYCVSFRNNGADRSYVAEYTINGANTWEQKTVTVAASPSAGTWNYTNNIGLRVTWAIACGSTFQTTAGSWQTGNFQATANQVNGVNTGATSFRITGVMINEGVIAAPFQLFSVNSFQSELAACQRFLPAFKPGVVNERLPGITFGSTTTTASGPLIFPVPTRVAVTGYILSSNSDFRLSNAAAGNIAITGSSLAVGGINSAEIQWTVASGITVQNSYVVYSAAGAGLLYFTGAEL